jgi:SAM-dependent methyltransferase
MTEKSSWERFFDAHAPIYEDNVFTKDTAREVDFLLEELQLPLGSTILDVGCGTGRHAIALTQRGYAVTGIDLSSEMLARAAAAAEAAGVTVEWVRANATEFEFGREFDAAICLCEGAMGLLSQSDDAFAQPISILSHIARSLKPGAKVIATVLNGTAMLRRHSNQDVAEGHFDPLIITSSGEFAPQEGLPEIALRQRSFAPSELVLMFRWAGMTVLHIWGGTAGNWGRRTLDLDEMEIMIVARKTPQTP